MERKPRIVGIVAEYNPFHRGHEYLIAQARQAGAQQIVAVMSGNYVQRGEPALFTKWARAKAALACGADLVIELPLPWSIAGAERFALGAVSLLDALGCVDTLVFGSESGENGPFLQAARLALSPELKSELKQELSSGITFAKARQTAVERLSNGNISGLLREPNNILAVEYCKAILQLNSALEPFPVLRAGNAHDSAAAPENGTFASASQLRAIIQQRQDFAPFLPLPAAKIFAQEISEGRGPASYQALETAVLAKLRCMSSGDMAMLPDVSEGLENRLWQAARNAVSLEDLFSRVKSKRYTHARIRRIVLAAFLGLRQDEIPVKPGYLRILGFSSRGRELLSTAKYTTKLPILTNNSGIFNLDKQSKNVIELENRVTDLYALCLPRIQPCGLEMTARILTPE